MLEAIRRKVMVRIHGQRAVMDKWIGSICPNIHKKLNAYILESGSCHAICNGDNKFEVMQQTHRFTVNLDSKTCSCRYWELSGLPCSHAIACIHYKTSCLDGYIACCYSIYTFKKTYSHCLQPVEGMDSWPISDRPRPEAPGYVRMPGRPSKKDRRREPDEKPKGTKMSRVGTVITCKLFHCIGHNKSTCHKRGGPQATVQNVGPSSIGVSASSSSVRGRASSSTSGRASGAARGRASGARGEWHHHLVLSMNNQGRSSK